LPKADTQLDLRALASAAYGQKQYAECARLYGELPGDALTAGDAYDAACCQALAGQKTAAFGLLQRAAELGFKEVAHVQADTDLESLHDDVRWGAVVAAVQAAEDSFFRSVNSELYRLFQEDQRDRSGDPTKIDWKNVDTRDAQRRERVRQIIKSGGASMSDDYFHAAMVFQHGTDTADYQEAHWLALKAVELEPTNRKARWLAAASRDRELMHLGKPQLYGTQFRTENGRWVLYAVDPSITDEERARWNVPPLEQAKKRERAMNEQPTSATP
jgi:hypothetical protein